MSNLNPQQRTTGAVALIAAAVTVGGWMAFVDPVKKPLAKARAETAAARDQSLDAQKYCKDIAQWIARLAAAQAADNSLRARVARGNDPQGMIVGLSAAAETAGVRIDSVVPADASAKRATRAAAKASAAPVADPAAPQDTAFGFSLSISGPYIAVARFLAAIEQDLGVSSVRSVRLQPASTRGDTFVNVELRCETFVPAMSKQSGTPRDIFTHATESEAPR